MKRITIRLSGIVVLPAVAFTCAASDYRVTENGVRTLPSPVAYDALEIHADGREGKVLFDQTQYAVTEEWANRFTSLKLGSFAVAEVLGGYWDFGAQDDSVNWFSAGNSSPFRWTMSFSDGAVVTNVGTAVLGGSTDGFDNTLKILGNARVHMNTLVLSRNGGGSNNKCEISAGGQLNLSKLDFTDTAHSLASAGNSVRVSGVTSRLAVSGDTYLSRPPTGDATGTTVGGNSLVVSDGAHAELSGLYVNRTVRHSTSNRVCVTGGAVLATTECYIGCPSLSFTEDSNRGMYDRFEVTDGAAYTNAGSFVFGYQGSDQKSARDETLVISNATFRTANFGKSGDTYLPIIRSAYSRLIVSGENAVFEIADNTGAYYNRPIFGQDHSEFILEAGAKWKMRNYCFGNGNQETMIVRGAGTELTTSCDAIGTGSWSSSNRTRGNRLILSDGATATAKYFACPQFDGEICVSNATLKATSYSPAQAESGSLGIGSKWNAGTAQYGEGSNCTLRIQGTCPLVNVANGRLAVANHSQIVWDLSRDPYERTPVTVNGSDSSSGLYMDDTCLFKVEGVKNVRRSQYAKYVSGGCVSVPLMTVSRKNIGAHVMENSNALVPEGATLRWSDDGRTLLADIELKGILVIVR